MFVELIDALRCPRPHEATWLVAQATESVDRYIVSGTLGCPVCHAEFPIERGVAHFEGESHRAAPRPRPSDDEAVMRLAAFLELTEPNGVAVLAGGWGSHAGALRVIAPTPLLLVNPPAGVEGDVGISALVAGDVLPLAPGSVRAAALDADAQGAALNAALAACVRPGGRIVAPATVPLPSGVKEVARDSELWVGEREGAPPVLVRLDLRGKGRER